MTDPFTLGPALLFCPADRPERYAKAPERADAVILDLEDAVAPSAKPAARDALVASLGTDDPLLADAVVSALDRFGDDAVPPLVDALGSPHPRVREHAAEALGHLGAAPAAERGPGAVAERARRRQDEVDEVGQHPATLSHSGCGGHRPGG